ncbi:DUF2141 domain-containing protein [Psychroserpens sp.]|uniref:DUF2141 domain-containing protein n=1 Tax=Psychroserpens sp. TaxID=2020870 RepID=UPI001B141CB8|nr:DUF2141 domain-containing protein [Psychroserpens sp.]MBO6607118.1 DUF2141 domain-containing protein [Psychroserpens sp.]MBO6630389.1 DUF2141 domain-containing protein [Psychroserpens sp.]MBO6654264.1 DUF2141 domain-containing protein [Psychroserpens sp.]MBO6682450.1 DUF2141 domain-containing protein [Psychroserpens sp.]MBO6750890.1 DUF2141 domain-containing protein [Psychroserpens sp.]
MKTLFVTIALCISTLGFTQNETKNTITVVVENFTSNEGKAAIALHTADTFMRGAGIQNLEAKIIDGKATFTFENVNPGEYALLVLHDKNENNRMDFEENGMPKESYGTSNNTRSFGPPIYDDAKFNVDKDLEITIRL